MTVLITPSAAGVLPPIRQEVFLNGVLRTDCYAVTSSEAEAEIVFPEAEYDSDMILENTLVEIKVPPYGVLFRGYTTQRGATEAGGVTYQALDYITKLQDQHFLQNYRYLDTVDPSLIKFNFNIRQIADIGHLLYLDWQTSTTPTDFLLEFNLTSFPAVFPELGTAQLKGKNLLAGLTDLLRQVDFRYSIRIDHFATRSIVSAYLLGTGAPRKIVRATDPTASPKAQPYGEANVMAITKNVDSANTISHVYGEGDNRKIEKAFALVQDFDLTDIENRLNNLERYINEASDDFEQVLTRICRYWTIPTIVDEADPTAQVLIESTLVQTWGGFEFKPFIVYRKTGDATFYAKHDGFSIVDNRSVTFDEPFCDTLTHVEHEGDSFSADDYDPGSNTTELDMDVDMDVEIPDHDDLISSEDGLWLFLGEKVAYYRIVTMEQTDVVVKGNLTGVQGGQYIITNKRFLAKEGTNGLGVSEGRYQIVAAGDDDTFTNEYAGLYLIAGEKDATGNWEDPTGDLEFWRIRANTEKYLYLDTTETVVGASAEYQIVNPRFDTKQQYSDMFLNAAYKSALKLQNTQAAGTLLANKRIVYKSNTSFKWTTQEGNYQLAGDGNTAVFNAGPTDSVKDDTELGVWALLQLQGINYYEITYTTTLPTFQVDFRIGDRLIDNEFDQNVTITGVRIDYRNGVVTITARSF